MGSQQFFSTSVIGCVYEPHWAMNGLNKVKNQGTRESHRDAPTVHV
jgi:hypothetical protein